MCHMQNCFHLKAEKRHYEEGTQSVYFDKLCILSQEFFLKATSERGRKTRTVENMRYNAHIFSARECKRYERGDSKRTIFFKRPYSTRSYKMTSLLSMKTAFYIYD